MIQLLYSKKKIKVIKQGYLSLFLKKYNRKSTFPLQLRKNEPWT